MAQMHESLRGQITHEMISKASKLVDEKESNMVNATSSVVDGLLATLLKRGNTAELKNILDEAANLNILADKKKPFENEPTQDQQKVGDDFLQHLLGDKAADFTDPIAEQAGISQVAANRLISMAAPVVAGYLGHLMKTENLSMTQLRSRIENESAGIVHQLPAKLIRSFGLTNLLKVDSRSSAAAGSTAETQGTPKKKGNKGIFWLILIIILVLLAFFFWRSCSKMDRNGDLPSPAEVMDTIKAKGEAIVDDVRTTELTLPNGTTLQVNRMGVEEKMVDYLQSDSYKNATDADLKKKWFEFDHIQFASNSTTQLVDGSQTQIDHIAAILKAFPNAKIKIGAYTDKVGSKEANLKISAARAKTVERLLDTAGVGAQVVKAEGYGEQYAEHEVDDSAQKREEDRDIAIRFVK